MPASSKFGPDGKKAGYSRRALSVGLIGASRAGAVRRPRARHEHAGDPGEN